MVISRVSINDNLKIVQFWLTNDENIDNPSIAENVESLFLPYKQDSKYRKIVYHSGTHALPDMTIGLLTQNN